MIGSNFCLPNRRHFCKVNGVSSKVEEVYCSVLQGSCLGPLFSQTKITTTANYIC